MSRFFNFFICSAVLLLFTGCASVQQEQHVKQVQFPKYGFMVNEPSWNTLNCNPKFMLYADEAKAKTNDKIKYDRGYLFMCNSGERSSQNGPDVRIGWKDARFAFSKVAGGIIGEIGNAYFGPGTWFYYHCEVSKEILNSYYLGSSQTCSIKMNDEKQRSYTVSFYLFATSSDPYTENWVMVVDPYNVGVATGVWLKKIVETIRPLAKQ